MLVACNNSSNREAINTLSPSKEPSSSSMPQKTPESLKVPTVNAVDISHENSDYNMTVFITYPVVEGIGNEEVKIAVNDVLYQHMILQQIEFESWAKADYENLTSDMEAWPHSLDYYYDVRTLHNDYISLTTTKYYYTGGAHPNQESMGFTFDLYNGKLLNFSDLFEEGYDYVTIINNEIFKKNKEFIGQSDNYTYIIEEFTGIEENPKFYIEDNKLIIFYNPYDIAAYALGYLEFELSDKVVFEIPKED